MASQGDGRRRRGVQYRWWYKETIARGSNETAVRRCLEEVYARTHNWPQPLIRECLATVYGIAAISEPASRFRLLPRELVALLREYLLLSHYRPRLVHKHTIDDFTNRILPYPWGGLFPSDRLYPFRFSA